MTALRRGAVERVLPAAQGIVLERRVRARWERQPSVEPRWRIELFGGLRAVRGETVVTQFRTQKSALLLAHLASLAQALKNGHLSLL